MKIVIADAATSHKFLLCTRASTGTPYDLISGLQLSFFSYLM